MRPTVRTALWFLVALAVGGAAAAVLGSAGLAEPWPVIVGWIVFLALGTLLARRATHRQDT